MGRNRTQATRDALALVASGVSVRQAARIAGVWYTGLHRIINRDKKKEQQK